MARIEQRTTILRGAKFDIEQVTLSRSAPDGRHVVREVIRHPGAVVIVPVVGRTASGEAELVMIRNQRFTLDRELLEFPAGTLEPPEPPEKCAARELEEEAGYRAGTMKAIGSFYTTPGMTDELMRAFVATELTPVGQRLMDDEEITVEIVPVSRALRMIDSGELADAKSMLALLLAARLGHV